MRISDWSSDVCSSDLVDAIEMKPFEKRDQWPFALWRQKSFEFIGADDDNGILAADCYALRPLAAGKADHLAEARFGVFKLDRKSVGEGKSVSGRVDIGGWRLIKKKKQTVTK